MIVSECSRDELKGLFSSGLSGLIRDDEVKVHVVGVLDGFISERTLPIKQTLADSVIINELFEKENYDALVFFGDAQLFMCGMFPEYLSRHRRHSLGIGFYVEKGIDSYNYALYLAISKKMQNSKAALVSKLSDSFIDNVNALLQLRNRLKDGEVFIDHSLCEELKESIGYKPNRAYFQVFQGSSIKAKESMGGTGLKTGAEETHLTIIK
jgi:hypothetical protein